MESKELLSVNKSSINNASSLILFLIWPVAALYNSLLNYKDYWSKNIFWLFCIFFGYTFIIAEEGGADSDRYARLFIYYAHSNLSLAELWNSFYTISSRSVDIASPLITYLVSRATDNPSILFTVFGLIFGYFYSRNIWFILERIIGKPGVLIFIFLVTFALLNAIWNINGFRFFTAAQVFLFGTLPYLLEGNSKSLIWSGISVFLFSFLLPVAVVILFILLKNKYNLYLAFFIISSFIKEIDLEAVRSTLSFLPGIFYSKVTQYANPDYALGTSIEALKDRWFVSFSNEGLSWVSYAMVLFISIFGRETLKERHDLRTLLCFSLLFYGFANIFSLVPVGGRFIRVVNTFMFPFLILYITSFSNLKWLRLIKTFSIPLLLLFIIVELRLGLGYFGVTTIFSNPILSAIYTDPLPIIEGIKRLF